MRYVWIVLAGAASYGLLSTFTKLAYNQGYGLGGVVGSQTLLGFIGMTIVAAGLRARRSSPRQRPSRRQAARLLLTGFVTGLTGIVYYGALQYIEASLAIILLFQFTWIGVLGEALIRRRKPDKGQLWALLPLLAGTVLAAGPDVWRGEAAWQGIVLGLASACTYSVFIAASGTVAPGVHPVTRSVWIAAGAALITMALLPPKHLFDGQFTGGLWQWGVLLAAFGVLLPVTAFAVGVPHIGPGLASILGAVELPVAVAMSYAVLGEPVSLPQWFGVLLILGGVALPELLRRRAPDAPPSPAPSR